jgi:hypothetical protein
VTDLRGPGIAVVEGTRVAIIVVEGNVGAGSGLIIAEVCGTGIVVVTFLGCEGAIVIAIILVVTGVAFVNGAVHIIVASRDINAATRFRGTGVRGAILLVVAGNRHVVAIPVLGITEVHRAEVIVIAIVVFVEAALFNVAGIDGAGVLVNAIDGSVAALTDLTRRYREVVGAGIAIVTGILV